MLHRRNSARFPPEITLYIQAIEFNIGSSDQRILFRIVWESIGAFWQTPSRLSCAFYWGVASVWPLYHKGLISGVLQRWLSFWKVLPSPQSNSRALSECPSPPIAQFGRAASSQRFLVVPNFFHLRMMEATVFLGTFNAAEMFWYPSPDLWLDTTLFQSSTDNSFDLMAWILLWHALSTYIDRSVTFQIMSNQFNLLQVDSKQVVGTSQRWSMESRCTWTQFLVSKKRIWIFMWVRYFCFRFVILGYCV
jgi:hypothetical protein